MRFFLALSARVDAVTRGLGRVLGWLIFASCAISAGNAIVRKVFNLSSNALLEIQWYLFATAFMLGAAYVLQLNEHVRIDVVNSRLAPRRRIWIDILGIVAFLFPTVAVFAWYGWPMFWQSFQLGESSADAGGLLRWPAKLLVPVGFTLLALQGVSELIKRLDALRQLEHGEAEGGHDA